MATKRLSAQIPDREIAIAAWALKMTDCTISEIGKAVVLTAAGYTPQEAKAEVLSLRKTVQMTDANVIRNFLVPDAWLEAAMDHEETPKDLSPSERFRYWCARLTESRQEAIERAKVLQGRPRGSRKQEATARVRR